MSVKSIVGVFQGDLVNNAITILKVYATKAALLAEDDFTFEADGKTLDIPYGGLVCVNADTDDTLNGVYRKIDTAPLWEYICRFGDNTVLAEASKVAAGISAALALEYRNDAYNAQSAIILGGIEFDADAPTPGKSGKYYFTTAGALPAWLTAENGETEVLIGQEVLVVYTAPSTYTYTLLAITENTGSYLASVGVLDEDTATYNEYIEGTSAFTQTGWLTNVDAVLKAGIIESIRLKLTEAGTITFGVGTINHYNLPVIRAEYPIALSSGENTEAVSIPIKAGEHLFIRLNGDGVNAGTLTYHNAGAGGGGTNFLYSDTEDSALAHLGFVSTWGGGIPFTFDVKYQDSVFVFKEEYDELLSSTGVLNEDLTTYNEYIEGSSGFNQTGWLTNYDPILHAGIVESIRLKVTEASTIIFAVGIIDQFDYPIIRNEYPIALEAGENIIPTSIPVEAGDHLFIRLNGNGVDVGTLTYHSAGLGGGGTNFWYSDALGQSLYLLGFSTEFGGGIPFTFDVRNKETIFVFKEEYDDLKAKVSNLQSIFDSMLTVPTVTKWLALGNSITRHGLDSFWWGDWGMAASVREKDWVHVLNSRFEALFGTAPTFDAQNISGWEMDYENYNKANYDGYFDGDEDLVVLRIGENAVYSSAYQDAFDLLIKYIKAKAPNARIVVTGNFWTSNLKDVAQKNASDANACLWCPLSQLDNSTNKATLTTLVYGDDLAWHTISDGGDTAPGVANHPSDVGMQNISNAIFSALQVFGTI